MASILLCDEHHRALPPPAVEYPELFNKIHHKELVEHFSKEAPKPKWYQKYEDCEPKVIWHQTSSKTIATVGISHIYTTHGKFINQPGSHHYSNDHIDYDSHDELTEIHAALQNAAQCMLLDRMQA